MAGERAGDQTGGGVTAPEPAPLWMALGGLAAAAAFSALAADSGTQIEVIALLTGAAAAGGLGLFALFERAMIHRDIPLSAPEPAPAGLDPALEAAPEPMILVDRSGRVTAINAAARAALSPERADAAAPPPRRAAELIYEPPADAESGSKNGMNRPEAPSAIVYAMMREAAEGRRARRRLSLRLGSGVADAVVDVWPARDGAALWRWRATSDAAALGDPDFGLSPGGGRVAWCRIGPTGRVIDSNGEFQRWLTGGPTEGERPSFQSIAPDAARRLFAGRLAGARMGETAPGGSGSPAPMPAASRVLGGPAAPGAAAMLLAPLRDGSEALAIMAPLERLDDDDVAPIDSPGGVGAALAAMDSARLFEDAPVGLVVLSVDGVILRLNGAADRLLSDGAPGRQRKDGAAAAAAMAGPLGDHLIDWIAPEDREEAGARLAAAARGLAGGGPAFEARLAADASQEGRAAQCHFSRIDTSKGRLLLGYLIDASEQRELKRSFIHSQRLQAVGDLSSGVAHDFNNLLSSILGSCEMLLAEVIESDPEYQDLISIQQNGQRAARLIRQLLAFSRKQTLEPEIADLNEETREVVSMMRRALGEKIEIEQQLTEDLPRVRVDTGQFLQVLSNLLVNARDAMPEGGRILISTAGARLETELVKRNFSIPPGEYVRLEVADTGCGIPPELLDKIFQPFVSTKKVGEGTGLGLSTVYGIVKQSGGYVVVESAVGEGTAFSIYLPVCPEEDDAAPAGARASAGELADALRLAGKAARQGVVADDVAGDAPAAADADSVFAKARALLAEGRSGAAPAEALGAGPVGPAGPEATPPGAVVLLVEDEDSLRVTYARYLRGRGYEVIEADCGEAALEVLEDLGRRVDVLVSDVVMPGLNGPAVVRALGAKRAHLQPIFMTGYARDAFKESLDGDATGGRIYQVLQKPFSLSELAAAVAETLRSSSTV